MPKTVPTARELAAGILGKVLSGTEFATDLLDRSLSRFYFSEADRALITQLTLGCLREKGFLDPILSPCLSFSKTPDAILQILRVAAYQIFFLTRIPERAAVHEAVEAAKAVSRARHPQLVNAVLRRLQRGKPAILEDREALLMRLRRNELPEEKDLHPLAWALSLPEWLLRRWLNHLSAQNLLRAAEYFNASPPIYLRVNPTRSDLKSLLARLDEAAFASELIPGTPVIRVARWLGKVGEELLQKGHISRQDLGSYRIVEALELREGESFLDACAGHGGKSSALAERYGDRIRSYVHEPSEKKREALRANFSRLGLSPPDEVAGPEAAAKRGLEFDRILVDAPCSGTGTLGRKPEIRWRLQPGVLSRFRKKQVTILREWLPRLKVGGRLLYAVCSLEPEEGHQVIDAVLSAHPELREVRRSTLWPQDTGHDGFFFGVLERNR